jgi:hypothetical protein
VRNLRGKSQGGAPGEEEEDRREKEALGSPSTTNSSGDACRRADLRRGICAAWRPDSRRERERKQRRAWGTYRRGLHGHYSREINGGITPTTVTREKRGDGIAGKKVSVLMRGPKLSARRERERVPIWVYGEVGRLRDWAEWLPRVHFYFYFFFSLFLFLFSELNQIFCKTPSNRFKQNSKFF